MNVGVTGGFLSGKTTLSRFLAQSLGYQYFSCDDFVKKLYKKKSVRKKVLDIFGEKVYKGNVLQKDQLSLLVFQSPRRLKKLESIIHPLVQAEIIARINRTKSTVFEIPLLYEKRWNPWMDICVLVWSDKKNCLSRAKQRGFTQKDYAMRTRFQLRTIKHRNAWILKNQGDLKTLKIKAFILANALKLL
jgi:dephospho-CoA kinase